MMARAATAACDRHLRRRQSAAPAWATVRQASSHAPLHRGWLCKRGELNPAWKRRYFALYSGITCVKVEGQIPPHDEPVLMYFKTESKFRELVDRGRGRPYQGAVRLSAITQLKRRRVGYGSRTGFALVTGDRTWLLSPDNSDTDLDAWWFALEGACHAAQRCASVRLFSTR